GAAGRDPHRPAGGRGDRPVGHAAAARARGADLGAGRAGSLDPRAADREGAGGAHPDGAGLLQPRDRGGALRRRGDREDPRGAGAREARCPRPRAGRHHRVRDRAGHPRLPLIDAGPGGPVIPRYDGGAPGSASAAPRTRPRGDDRSPPRPRGWSSTSSPPREGTLMTTAPQAAPPTTTGGPAPALVARRVTRRYGAGAVTALDAVDLEIGGGAFTAIMGPSGSGKSTLLHVLAGLDAVDDGSIVLEGTEITGLGDDALTRLRRERIGFVFQSFNLLPMLSAEQNILLPLELAGRKVDRAWLDTLTSAFGIGDRLDHLPSQLS